MNKDMPVVLRLNMTVDEAMLMIAELEIAVRRVKDSPMADAYHYVTHIDETGNTVRLRIAK